MKYKIIYIGLFFLSILIVDRLSMLGYLFMENNIEIIDSNVDSDDDSESMESKMNKELNFFIYERAQNLISLFYEVTMKLSEGYFFAIITNIKDNDLKPPNWN